MRSRRLRRIGATLFIVSAVAVLVALATGEVRLVTTHGVSMEPRFHTGDLAIIVRAPSYHVGEIVGYYSPLLHIIVLHRIVAEHAGRFTFKGDNNDFLDPLKLSSAYVRGRLVLHIPKGGEVLSWFRTPFGLATIAFAFVAVGVSWESRRQRLRRRKARSFRRAGLSPEGRAPVAVGPRHAAPKDVTAVARWPLVFPAAAMVLSALFGVVAWTHAGTRPSVKAVAYKQGVTFSYTARVPKGTAYPSGLVQTGQPVFVKLTDGVLVTARYRLHPGATGAGAADLSGTIGASVDLLGPEGWTGHVTSTGPVAFTGTTATITGGIDFARVTAVEHAFAQETGVPLGPGNVVVTPTVRVRGSVGGAPVRTSYAPALTFQLSSSEFSLASASPTAGGGGEQLDPSASGSGERLVEVPATLPVLGIPLRVGAARTLALLGMLLSLVAGLAVLGWLERRRRMDEPTRIRASHGHSLVSVSSSPALDAPLVVDVETFGGLVRLAERFDCVILDLGHGAGHTYYVECGATVYRYGLEPGDEALPGPSDDPGPPGDLTYHVKALRSVS